MDLKFLVWHTHIYIEFTTLPQQQVKSWTKKVTTLLRSAREVRSLEKTCLSPFGLLSQNITDRMAYKRQKLVAYSPGGWKAEIKAPAGLPSGKGLLPDSRLAPRHWAFTWWKAEGYLGNHFYKVLIPRVRASPSWSEHPRGPAFYYYHLWELGWILGGHRRAGHGGRADSHLPSLLLFSIRCPCFSFICLPLFFLPSMISSISWFHFLSSLSTLITCSFFLFTSLVTAPEFAMSIFKRCDAVSWGAGNLEPSALKSSFLVLIVLRPRPSLVRRCDRRTRRRHHYLEQTVIHSFN